VVREKVRIRRNGGTDCLQEQDYKTIREIASEVGYDDLIFFRNLFKGYAGVPPQTYRQTFGRRGSQPAA
jgi:YesN/AraC family two-component response regulator